MTVFAQRMKTMEKSAAIIRGLFGAMNDPGIISFGGGAPAREALPIDIVREITNEVITRDGRGVEALQYGNVMGLPDLRDIVVSELLAPKGVEADAGRIIITSGGLEGMNLLCQLFIDPGDVILVESPTFVHCVEIFEMFQARCVSVAMDENGMIPEDLEAKIREFRPKMMYVIPTFQNPTGRTLSLERRKQLAVLAAKYGVVLAEDDPYRDVRFAGSPLPSIKSFDESGWVVYLGSFSKVIAPGLRVGFAVVDNEALMKKMIIGKQATDVHSPLLSQAIVDGYLRSGRMEEHLKRISQDYKARLNVMLDGLDKLPPSVTHTRPEGGLFVWAQLPEGADALKMLGAAIEKNVAFVPGTHFYFDGGHLNTLRLNFSSGKTEDVAEGMARLTPVILETLETIKTEGSR